MADLHHRRAIRLAELQNILPAIPKRGRLLEIGAGAGWQAKALATAGFDVVAIDVNLSNYQALREQRVWPILEYDGVTIPYPDRSFDFVFSSNTLPHIPDLDRALLECWRVLKDDGIAVHILPTVTWRVWTFFGHFVNYRLFSRAWRLLSRGNRDYSSEQNVSAKQKPQLEKNRTVLFSMLKKALPRRLGERGNIFSEAFLFSERAWTAVFRSNRFVVSRVISCGVYNTGHHLLGPRISVVTRQRIAAILGSSCKAYLLRKSESS